MSANAPFITVPDGHHARLSASSSYRWMKCPGSARLVDEWKEAGGDDSTRVSAEGTAAHALAQHCFETGSVPGEFDGRCIKVGAYNFVIDSSMADPVALYVAYVNGSGAQWGRSEVDVTPALQRLRSDFGGMADHLLLHRDSGRTVLEVVDYKHGAGVFVEVKHNRQLKYYALGALLTFKQPVDTVRITIVQPRIESEEGTIRSFDFDAIDLVDFAADLVDAARVTDNPNAPLVPGNHCSTTFCPARATCPALLAWQTELMKAEFNPIVGALDNDRLGYVLDMLPAVEARIKALRELGYKRAMAGQKPTGHKLVDKRAIRKYKDVSVAEAAFEDEPGMWEKPKLKSPAQAEKALGTARYTTEVAPLVEKKPSGYNLVPESHPSPPATLLAKPTDFEAIPK